MASMIRPRVGSPLGTAAGLSWQMLSFVTVTIAIVLATCFALPSLKWVALRVAGSPLPPSKKLKLRCEIAADSLRISWNAESAGIRPNTGALLVIRDGSSEQRIDLSPSALPIGGLVYQADTSDVSVELNVASKAGRNIKETVLALLPVLSPLDLPGSSIDDLYFAATGERSGVRNRASEPKEGLSERSMPTREQQVSSLLLRSEPEPVTVVENTQVRRTIPTAASIDDTSPPEPPLIGPSAAPDLPEVLLKREPAITTGWPSSAELSKPLNEVRTQSTSILTREPQVRRQVQPQVPTQIRSMLFARQEVDVLVKINESGRVTSAIVASQKGSLSGHLVPLALDAARHWVFAPARRGDQNVPSEHVIMFLFSR